MSVSTSKAKARSFRITPNKSDEVCPTDMRRNGLFSNRSTLLIVPLNSLSRLENVIGASQTYSFPD